MNLPRLNASLSIVLAVFYFAWWTSVGAPTTTLALSAVTLAAVPLLLLAPALLYGNRFGSTLAGFILPFHFAYAVMELVANPHARAWIAAQTFLSLLLLIGVMANLRQAGSPGET